MKVLVLGNSNSIVSGGYIGGLLAQLDVEKAGPIDLNLTVQLMKLGVGLEVAGIRLTGDREAGGALKAYRAVQRLVSAARS